MKEIKEKRRKKRRSLSNIIQYLFLVPPFSVSAKFFLILPHIKYGNIYIYICNLPSLSRYPPRPRPLLLYFLFCPPFLILFVLHLPSFLHSSVPPFLFFFNTFRLRPSVSK
ncbi:hypothetical protein, unlikely [Trypanosoma brucei gambiense DAL972]|uniref:Uncharacterized protein n=1 Tax=Trypanosoma brucei gambiense (strain MHOM/CI/86/DAL972) TaxID=679716 RepID=C9ZT56_TRYB9|nr:hypothetical protein, unlikely [Trypanosoma brucei gambiense DAL972]CBH12591.1 hypothetical protein, unlikely [Trypanosoma brucei gambiense DAL972]|eukprot:XP_011774871.1 hypothetical protein, unlikely [Trypanosoma brucei gambiense DAL972]